MCYLKKLHLIRKKNYNLKCGTILSHLSKHALNLFDANVTMMQLLSS